MEPCGEMAGATIEVVHLKRLGCTTARLGDTSSPLGPPFVLLHCAMCSKP